MFGFYLVMFDICNYSGEYEVVIKEIFYVVFLVEDYLVLMEEKKVELLGKVF